MNPSNCKPNQSFPPRQAPQGTLQLELLQCAAGTLKCGARLQLWCCSGFSKGLGRLRGPRWAVTAETSPRSLLLFGAAREEPSAVSELSPGEVVAER